MEWSSREIKDSAAKGENSARWRWRSGRSYNYNFLQEKPAETTNQPGENMEEKPHTPKPEKQGDMPQHRHCPHAKYRVDRNPNYHEEQQQKDVAKIFAAHPQRLSKGNISRSTLIEIKFV
jgi:hypothetical protein